MYVLEGSNPFQISEAEGVLNELFGNIGNNGFLIVNGVSLIDAAYIEIIDHRESGSGDDCTITIAHRDNYHLATVSFDPESQKIIANTVYSETNALIITVEDRNLIEESLP